MKKEKDDPNEGYKFEDRVRAKKRNVIGTVKGFEWSGVRRALIEMDDQKGKGFAVIALTDLELVSRPEPEKEEVIMPTLPPEPQLEKQVKVEVEPKKYKG